MRCLIVDDERIVRETLRKMISTYGECIAVSNGNAAIEIFKKALEDEHPFDLICMDIMMPEVSGHETLQAIRQIEKERCTPEDQQVTVFMTTAMDDQRNVIESFYKGGASSYLVKPIHTKDLRSELKKAGLIDKE